MPVPSRRAHLPPHAVPAHLRPAHRPCPPESSTTSAPAPVPADPAPGRPRPRPTPSRPDPGAGGRGLTGGRGAGRLNVLLVRNRWGAATRRSTPRAPGSPGRGGWSPHGDVGVFLAPEGGRGAGSLTRMHHGRGETGDGRADVGCGRRSRDTDQTSVPARPRKHDLDAWHARAGVRDRMRVIPRNGTAAAIKKKRDPSPGCSRGGGEAGRTLVESLILAQDQRWRRA